MDVCSAQTSRCAVDLFCVEKEVVCVCGGETKGDACPPNMLERASTVGVLKTEGGLHGVHDL